MHASGLKPKLKGVVGGNQKYYLPHYGHLAENGSLQADISRRPHKLATMLFHCQLNGYVLIKHRFLRQQWKVFYTDKAEYRSSDTKDSCIILPMQVADNSCMSLCSNGYLVTQMRMRNVLTFTIILNGDTLLDHQCQRSILRLISSCRFQLNFS